MSANSGDDKLTVLFVGENWYGSCARACCYSLRRLGCDVIDVDSQTVFPMWRSKYLRVGIRIANRVLVAEYNRQVLDAARTYRPQVLVAFKGHYLRRDTLCRLRETGVALYNYYPDPSVFAYGSVLPAALPEYDCVFLTKPFLEADIRRSVALRAAEFLPHGYDPEIHKPTEVSLSDHVRYGFDAVLIATHTKHKEETVDAVLRAIPNVKLAVWGNGWDSCQSERVRGIVRGRALNGASYARALQTAKVSLGIMGQLSGWPAPDQTTTRTYEIPACGGFMLHERTPEVLSLYEEGKEMACFSSPAELADKIAYYLEHDDERAEIARAGHRRCVPAYSYDCRMETLLRWHSLHKGLRR